MFHSDKFEWDGVSNEELGLYLVTFDNDILSEYGFSYVETLDNNSVFNDNPYYFKGESKVDEIILNFCLATSYDTPLEWDDYTIDEICNLFMTNDFKPFVSHDNFDYVYYLKATKIKKMFTTDKKGYLEITFQPYTSYAYKKYTKHIKTIDGSLITTVINYSNADDTYKPVIEIENMGTEATVNTICNTTINNTPLEIKGLKTGEKLIIDCLYYTVIDDKGNNKFSHVNRKWIELLKGTNKINITGDCKVTFKAEYPIIT